MKQSSIDFLAEKHDKLVRWMEGDAKAEPYSFTDFSNDLNTAREMHRQEIEKAYEAGFYDDMEDGKKFDTKYYTKKFQQNG